MRDVLTNAQNVLAIELLAAAQAIDWRAGLDLDPLAPRRTMSIEESEQQARDFESSTRGRARDIALRLGRGTRETYLRVRDVVEPVYRDRPLADDIRRILALLPASGEKVPRSGG
jgi:histidine ammonia-lyase